MEKNNSEIFMKDDIAYLKTLVRLSPESSVSLLVALKVRVLEAAVFGGGWDGFGGRGREFGDGHNPGELLRMGIMKERIRGQGMTSRGNFEEERRRSSQKYLEEFRR